MWILGMFPGIWVTFAEGIPLWAIVRTWPVPMPVHENSSVLPAMFSTDCEAGLPCIRPLGESTQKFTATNFTLRSALCFTFQKKYSLYSAKKESSECVAESL